MTCKRLINSIIAFAIVIGIPSTASSIDYCGDANGDKQYDIDDVVYMINFIFAGGPAPDGSCCNNFETGTVTDYDGNVYQTVRIGDQWWMAENLKVTHYRNGDTIQKVTGTSEWGNLSTGAYCEHDNDSSAVDTYGRLYNWFAVDDARGIAPEGWHVPTDDDWKQLEMYLGMSQAEADGYLWHGTNEGDKLKETGTAHWLAPNFGATDEVGFTALPGAERGRDGAFSALGITAYFWASDETNATEAWSRHLLYTRSDIYRYDYVKVNGFSVRCVKDSSL